MQFHLFSATVLAFAAICLVAPTQAQSQSLPQCAEHCLSDHLPQSSCAPTDQTCICVDAELNAKLSACVEANCTLRESLTTLNATHTQCDLPIRDHSMPSILVPAVGMAIFIPMMILRLYTRTMVVKTGLGWDDWAAILLMLILIPGNVMSIVLADIGLGKDIWTIEFQDITRLLYIFYIQEFLYVSAISVTKIAFLLFYISIFPSTQMRWMIKGSGVVMVCYGVSCLIAFAFQCSPISYNWNGWDGEHVGTCVKKNDLIIASGAINVVLDAWVIALPIPPLMKLQMSMARKLQIVSMFSLGFLITGISIYRVVMLKMFATSSNPTWDHAAPGFWSLAEVNVGICCLCLPAIRPLLSHYFPKAFGTRQADTNRSLTGHQSVSQKAKRAELGSQSNHSFVQLIDLNKGNGKGPENDY